MSLDHLILKTTSISSQSQIEKENCIPSLISTLSNSPSLLHFPPPLRNNISGRSNNNSSHGRRRKERVNYLNSHIPLPHLLPSILSLCILSLSLTSTISVYFLSLSRPKENDLPRSSSRTRATTSIHVTALDGIVNVNSLFTIAVFVGVSLTTPGQRSLENRNECDAGLDVEKWLLVLEVVSFSFFLFSSLIAQGLKLALNLQNSKDKEEAIRAHIDADLLKFGMMASAVGSFMGCIFLMFSIVNVVQIRLGLLSCRSQQAVRAVAALFGLVLPALLAYMTTSLYAFKKVEVF